MSDTKQQSRIKRRARIRRKLSGTTARPRLTVYKSLKHIYAQVVDDSTGKTLVAASDLDRDLRQELKEKPAKKTEVAKKVGALIARRCLEGKIDQVVFDRNGFPYHGRVEAVAAAARASGLKF